MRILTLLLVSTVVAFAFGGCAAVSRRADPSQWGFKSRTLSRSDGGVRVSTSVLSAAESLAVYGVPLAKKGIQPVWIEVENRDAVAYWLELQDSVAAHVRQFGYDQITLKVDGLSSSTNNARQIRDAIMQMESAGPEPRLVLIGYSKGTPDILEAVVSYPEIRPRVAAVVSASGAVGGSPLANDADQSQLALLQHWPGARCTPDDGRAVVSLRPGTRLAWLATHPLPREVPYYSVVTFPDPGRISRVLSAGYTRLSRVDARNDSQMLFYDQGIPGSTLVGYLNADHWALAVPISRSHPWIGSTLLNHNGYPREALLEVLLRFVEWDLETGGRRD